MYGNDPIPHKPTSTKSTHPTGTSTFPQSPTHLLHRPLQSPRDLNIASKLIEPLRPLREPGIEDQNRHALIHPQIRELVVPFRARDVVLYPLDGAADVREVRGDDGTEQAEIVLGGRGEGCDGLDVLLLVADVAVAVVRHVVEEGEGLEFRRAC